LTGATNFNSRRLFEMYSNESCLKIAKAKCRNDIDPVQQETMAKFLEQRNRPDTIMVVSKIEKSGWK
jgi:hypothetical protein